MRILLHTRFYPNLGGIETVAWLLAHEWQRLGEAVTVVSDVACSPAQRREFPFPVHYRPNPLQWLRLMRRAEVFVHMNISLRAYWPRWLRRCAFVAVHQGHYGLSEGGERPWRERLKLRLAVRARANISASRAIARSVGVACTVIPNPVDLSLFQANDHVTRTRDLVFLGRLVSDKGCDLLLQALRRLAERGAQPSLTVIGDGPERSALQQLTASLNLQDQVSFAGALQWDKVADLLRQHKILVVPSVWEEPFGVVALEGAACGCVVLGSDGGGLPEAIGPSGTTFRRGDVSELTDKLAHLLQHPEGWEKYRAAAPAHLERHHAAKIAARYLEVMREAIL